jgi:hypothetical protein
MNPFLALAERQTPSPVKARQRAADTRRSKRLQQAEDEQRKLSAHYRAHRRQELEAALAGEDGAKLQALIARLATLTLDTIPELAALVAPPWHSAAFIARQLVSEAIVKLREQDGLAPFDDPLPGEPATPEQLLRNAFADNPERDALDHQKAHENGNFT